MSIIKGKYVSVWDDGEVVSSCTLDTDTGELSPEVVDAPDMGALKREYFEDEQGNEYQVCPTCHEYVTTTVVTDRADLSYGETEVCSNPDCES